MRIINARIWDPYPRNERAIFIKDGKITGLEARAPGAGDSETLDAEGLMAVPGFIDLHVHGGGGCSCMEGTAESVITMCNTHAQFGTTTILPTTMTAPLATIYKAIDAVKEAAQKPCDATIAGIHLEGPFLSPEQAGAQQVSLLLKPNRMLWEPLLERWNGIRMMGIAPELEGAFALGDELARRGIVASVAHSQAFEETMDQAVCHGFSDVTHLYSGCSTFARKEGFRIPGVVECALANQKFTVQVICDGWHLPLKMIRLIWNAKGTENMYLITDALENAGMKLTESCVYSQWNGTDVIYEDGVMKLRSRQAFAGSVVTADVLLRTAVRAEIPLSDALYMLTVSPAKRIAINHCKGRLAAGYDADIVLIDDQLSVVGCISSGRVIRWKRKGH